MIAVATNYRVKRMPRYPISAIYHFFYNAASESQAIRFLALGLYEI